MSNKSFIKSLTWSAYILLLSACSDQGLSSKVDLLSESTSQSTSIPTPRATSSTTTTSQTTTVSNTTTVPRPTTSSTTTTSQTTTVSNTTTVPRPTTSSTTTTSQTTTVSNTTVTSQTTSTSNVCSFTSSIVSTSTNPVTKPWDYQVKYPSQSACGIGEGVTYEVGPGKTYASPKNVPWLKVKGCDQVLIYYRTTPYNDIIFFSSRGDENKWIVIKGVPGPNGEKPIMSGENAVMPATTGANQWSDSAGMFTVFRATTATNVSIKNNLKPGYLQIDGFKIINSNPDFKVTNLSGQTGNWGSFSSGIYVAGADFVAITNNEITNNGLGIFVNSTNGEDIQSRGIYIAKNYVYKNSNVGSFSEHNSYTEAIGTVYESNYFGPIKDGSNGDNIKDRSAGVIFRYNYIEGGADQIALRDPESNRDYEMAQVDVFGQKLVTKVFIYSNIFVTKWYVQGVIGFGDGTMSTNGQVREGHMYFYNNRVITKVDNESFWQNNAYFDEQGVSVFDMVNFRSPATVVARNNLFHSSSRTINATPAPIAIFKYQGLADFQSNWINSRFQNYSSPFADGGLSTGTPFNGSGLGGLAPSTADAGFMNLSAGDYRLKSTSPYYSLKAALPSDVTNRCLEPKQEPVSSPSL